MSGRRITWHLRALVAGSDGEQPTAVVERRVEDAADLLRGGTAVSLRDEVSEALSQKYGELSWRAMPIDERHGQVADAALAVVARHIKAKRLSGDHPNASLYNLALRDVLALLGEDAA